MNCHGSRNAFRILLIPVFCLFFSILAAGCGGGDSGGEVTSETTYATGRAVLGPLCNANVNLYSWQNLEDSLYSTTTSDSTELDSAGLFDLPEDLIDDSTLYVVTVSGGSDIDYDDDGVVDDMLADNEGVLHMISTGAMLKAGLTRANILTDIVYHKLSYLLLAGYTQQAIRSEMDQYAKTLLKEDVDGSGTIVYNDLLAWEPVSDHEKSAIDWAALQDCSQGILSNTGYSDILEGIQKSVVASLDTPGYAWGMTIVDDYAYVADDESGVQVVDLSDPLAPRIVSTWDTPSEAHAVAVDGDYAYVADGYGGVQQLAVSDPAFPILLNIIDTPGRAQDIAFVGDYLYVADNYAGLQVIDISNLASPQLIENVDISGQTFGVAVNGNYAYLSQPIEGLVVVDISNPSAPSVVKTIPEPEVITAVVSGDRLYLACLGSGFSVYDVSDPGNPVKITAFDTNGRANSLAVRSSTVFVADYAAGFQAVSISDPENPVSLGAVNTQGYAWDIALIGSYACLAVGESGLQIIDTSVPGELKNNAVISNVAMPSVVSNVEISDGYVYIAAGGLQVVDITDPENPVIAAECVAGSLAMSIDGSHAYLAGNYLWAADISDPLSPKAEGTGPYNNFPLNDIAVSGGYAFATCSYQGLYVADISDHWNITWVVTASPPNYPLGITLAGDYAYVADAIEGHPSDPDSTDGLRIVDISEPVKPVSVSAVETPGHAEDVLLEGNYAYVADGDAGLQVVDISDPTDPVLLAGVDTPGYAQGVAISGDYAYVAAGDAGLCLIDISDPSDPVMAGTVTSVDICRKVAVSGGYVYLAEIMGGLTVFRAVP